MLHIYDISSLRVKTLHVSVAIVWPSSGGRLLSLVLLLLLCFFASSSCLLGMWLYVVYVCAWLMYLSVWCLVVKQPKHHTDNYIRHAHTQTTYSRIPNKQLEDANKQISSNSTKHVVKLFIWCVALCCSCVCVADVLVCGMFGCETNKTSHRQVHQARTHIDSIQPHTK